MKQVFLHSVSYTQVPFKVQKIVTIYLPKLWRNIWCYLRTWLMFNMICINNGQLKVFSIARYAQCKIWKQVGETIKKGKNSWLQWQYSRIYVSWTWLHRLLRLRSNIDAVLWKMQWCLILKLNAPVGNCETIFFDSTKSMSIFNTFSQG